MDFPRLYAILDADVVSARGLNALDVVGAWLSAGVRLVQLRAKNMDGGPFLDLADQLQHRVQHAGGSLIINDRVDIARMSGAAGVHVGQTDLTPRDVRTVIGNERVVGLSTHDNDQLVAGAGEGVSYLAIGPVFPTATKRKTGNAVDPAVGLEGVRVAAARLTRSRLPLVAIGGITLERAPEVLAAGAVSVAVISDLLVGAPESRARAFIAALM